MRNCQMNKKITSKVNSGRESERENCIHMQKTDEERELGFSERRRYFFIHLNSQMIRNEALCVEKVHLDGAHIG